MKTIKEETIQVPFNDFFIATDLVLLQVKTKFWAGFAQENRPGYHLEYNTLEEAQFSYEALKEILTCTDHACELCKYRNLCFAMDELPDDAVEITSEMTWED